MKGKDKVLRSPAEARAQSNLNISELPDGFPVGPLPCMKDELLATVKAFTTRVDTGGGGFTVCLSGSKTRTTVGDRVGLACCARSRKTGVEGCKWEVDFEQTSEGWLLVRYRPHFKMVDTGVSAYKKTTANHHSHELVKSNRSGATNPRCAC